MNAPILALTEPNAQNPNIFGSKAATLARLTAIGLRVPPGVALGAPLYVRAIGEARLPSRSAFPDFRSWAAQVHDLLLSVAIPTEVMDELGRQLAAIGSGPWIVRSSAVGEDGATSSFAGQLDSVGDVTADNLGAAIASVWASAWSSRAALYRERRDLTEPDDLAVGVLIMPFIEPDYAGVAFTSSPLLGEEGMVVEAVQGRGEQLVGGHAIPSRYRFDEFGQPLPDGGSATIQIPFDLLRELHDVGHSLASTFGCPQDIEWLARDGDLVIVQARPITTAVRSGTNTHADPDDFLVSVCVVDSTNEDLIPLDLASKDKFKLRLLASTAGVQIGRGWLITVNKRGAEDDDAWSASMSIRSAASQISEQVQRFEQVSVVLQNPPRLDGEIVRQFTDLGDLEQTLRTLIAQVGSRTESFAFIATEIFEAHQSGISHLVSEQLVVEVAFGSYVPKGIVPTSLYVQSENEVITQHVEVVQESGIFIHRGRPQDRYVNASATLSPAQLGDLRRMTSVVADSYPDVSVEFGVLEDGLCYLIDIIPDMAPVDVTDVRIMSPGRVSGTGHVSNSDDLAAVSLNAHFHSERSATSSNEPAAIVVAPRPFLALENYLADHGPNGIGFIFDHGSLLGHLAIILREHGVPAVVVSDACSIIADGAHVTIDTTTDALYSVSEPIDS